MKELEPLNGAEPNSESEPLSESKPTCEPELRSTNDQKTPRYNKAVKWKTTAKVIGRISAKKSRLEVGDQIIFRHAV